MTEAPQQLLPYQEALKALDKAIIRLEEGHGCFLPEDSRVRALVDYLKGKTRERPDAAWWTAFLTMYALIWGGEITKTPMAETGAVVGGALYLESLSEQGTQGRLAAIRFIRKLVAAMQEHEMQTTGDFETTGDEFYDILVKASANQATATEISLLNEMVCGTDDICLRMGMNAQEQVATIAKIAISLAQTGKDSVLDAVRSNLDRAGDKIFERLWPEDDEDDWVGPPRG